VLRCATVAQPDGADRTADHRRLAAGSLTSAGAEAIRRPDPARTDGQDCTTQKDGVPPGTNQRPVRLPEVA
jgi:hypothetical protein